jgi:acetyl esterase/lipase
MPSLQGRFFNAAIRQFIRRKYGRDDAVVARQARRLFGSPKLWQRIKTRSLHLQSVNEKNVRGEWLETKKAGKEKNTIFYIHGGGYVSCSARTHRPISATLARLTNFRVFSLDYRLAPEHRFPAALDDALAGYEWMLGKQNISPSKIALAGDSAGGGLVLALLLRLRDSRLPLPTCAVCFSPWTDLAGTGESVRANANRDDLFYTENISEFAAAYLGESSAENPLTSPVLGDFRNLPPILFHVGSTEILLDDARRIHQKIQTIGGTSELEIYDDIFHCWQMAVGLVPEARDSLSKATEFIRRHISQT